MLLPLLTLPPAFNLIVVWGPVLSTVPKLLTVPAPPEMTTPLLGPEINAVVTAAEPLTTRPLVPKMLTPMPLVPVPSIVPRLLTVPGAALISMPSL